MKIAAIQMRVIDGNPSENRAILASMMDLAPDSDICLAPELWTCGYVHSRWADIAANDTPVTIDWMADQASSRKIWLGGSLIFLTPEGKLANRFVLFNPKGTPVCEYDKAHLFRPLQEEVYLEAGNKLPPIVQIEDTKVAPAICYDLRFPEMFRIMVLRGAEVFLISNAWPKPRQHALKVLAEARAIENQAYVVIANRVGPDTQGNVFCGGSGIYGPLGMISEAGESVGVVSVKIDIGEMRKLRETFPVLKHRRKAIDYE